MMKLDLFGSSKNRGERGVKKEKELEDFMDLLMKMDTKEKMRDFLAGILTPKELEEIPNRLEIVKMLKRGVSHHEIAGKLGVGVATVGRGSQELQKGRFQYV
jgi:TrpR family trp operon transcriptional repressor